MLTTTVSFTEFRDNLSRYLEFLKKEGTKVTLKDARSGEKFITLVGEKNEESMEEYLKWIKTMKPFLTEEGVRSMKKFRRDINKRFELARKRV